MAKLGEPVDYVIGVDTHKHSHTASVVDALGTPHGTFELPADARGYSRMLDLAEGHAPGVRVWAVEGAGGYGSGLATHLAERGERVVEIDRPKRPARRNGAKTDALDATRAAREHLARGEHAEPRARGAREAVRAILRTREGAVRARTQAVNHLHALTTTAPEDLRAKLRGLGSKALAERCAKLRTAPAQCDEVRGTVVALRAAARRIRHLGEEIKELDAELEPRVRALAPALLDETGIGPVNAAEMLCAWSHPGRVRSEAAFASLAGAAPIPASSGQTVRHRLDRCGDRRLNRALHSAVLIRCVRHAETRRYVERRRAEGKTDREIRRCLKRFLARRVFKILEAGRPLPSEA